MFNPKIGMFRVLVSFLVVRRRVMVLVVWRGMTLVTICRLKMCVLLRKNCLVNLSRVPLTFRKFVVLSKLLVCRKLSVVLIRCRLLVWWCCVTVIM